MDDQTHVVIWTMSMRLLFLQVNGEGSIITNKLHYFLFDIMFLPILICLSHLPFVLRDSLQNSLERRFLLELAIKQQRLPIFPPAICITDPPHRDTNTLLHLETRLHSRSVLLRVCTFDIEFRDGYLGCSPCEGLKGIFDPIRLSRFQVRLTSNTINGYALSPPLLDLCDYGLRLFRRCGIKTGGLH